MLSKGEDMVKDLATIIIPLYNCGHILEKNIDNFIGQTYEHCEFIFVDDNSDDSSYQCIPKRGNIKVFHHNMQKGPGEARNTGLIHANGEFIFFFDGDDCPSKQLVEKCVNHYKKTKADIIVFNYFDSDKPGMRRDFSNVQDKIEHPLIFDPAKEGSVWNKMFLYAIIEKYQIRFADNSVANEDICFTTEYISHASKAAFLDEALYTYVINPNSVTSKRSSDPQSVLRFINSSYYIETVGIKNNYDFSQFLHTFVYKCLRMAMRNYLNSYEESEKIFSVFYSTERFCNLIEKANSVAGLYSYLYEYILSNDFNSVYKFMRTYGKNSISNSSSSKT